MISHLKFDDTEIEVMKRMLRHDSIDFPITEIGGVPQNTIHAWSIISVMRSLWDKYAIDESDIPFHIRLSSIMATKCGVVRERPTIDSPLRWMPRSQAIALRLKREGRNPRQRTINECDLTRRFYGNYALENIPDHRRDYLSPIEPDSVLKIVGASNPWNSFDGEDCPECGNNPKRNEYCLRCNRYGGYSNRKRT